MVLRRQTFMFFRLTMKNIEQELKMRLDEREYDILLQKSDERPVLQTNYYFASDEIASDVMVRIRQKGAFVFAVLQTPSVGERRHNCMRRARMRHNSRRRAPYVRRRFALR